MSVCLPGIYVTTLTNSHDFWVMTNRTRSLSLREGEEIAHMRDERSQGEE